MGGFKKQKHNPIDLIKSWWPEADMRHIEYDPNMKDDDRDFWMIRQSGGDGTHMFTIEMLQKALAPIVNMRSYCKDSEPKDWSKVKSIKYKIGPIRHATVFGMIQLRCSSDRKYPGQRERVRMPVKCEYVLDSTTR